MNYTTTQAQRINIWARIDELKQQPPGPERTAAIARCHNELTGTAPFAGPDDLPTAPAPEKRESKVKSSTTAKTKLVPCQ